MDEDCKPSGSLSGATDADGELRHPSAANCPSSQRILSAPTESGGANCETAGPFRAAYNKCSSPLEEAIRSLDELNRRIDSFRDSSVWQSPSLKQKTICLPEGIFKNKSIVNPPDRASANNNNNPTSTSSNGGDVRQETLVTLESSVQMIQNLLEETQEQCVKMVNDNRQVSTHLDDELGRCQNQMENLRKELAHAHRCVNDLEVNMMINGSATESDNEALAEHEMEATIYRLREDNSRLQQHIQALQQEMLLRHAEPSPPPNGVAAATANGDRSPVINGRCQPVDHSDHASTSERLQTVQLELVHTREALIALKHDRKRLKAEKVELLNQMKEVYQTLECKERELRDFIRQFEQKMRDSDKGIKELIWEKERIEHEKQQLTDSLAKAYERSEQHKCDLEKEKAENCKLHAQLKELQGRFVLLTGRQPTDPVTTNGDDASGNDDHGGVHGRTNATPTSVGYASMTVSPAEVHNGNDSGPQSGDRLRNGCSVEPQSTNCNDCVDPTKRMSQLFPTVDSTVYYEEVGAGVLQPVQQSVVMRRTRVSRKDQESGNRLSRLFSLGGRSKSKDETSSVARLLHEQSVGDEQIVDPITADLDLVEKADQLLQARQSPMGRWRQSHVLAWVELELSMSAYVAKFADNVKSGKVLLALTDHEIEHVLHIASPLHRKKLRLAIEEYRAPALCKFPCIKDVTNQYVCRQWLPSIGLPQYVKSFQQHLIDGRLLNYLNKKQMDKYLGVSRRFHQTSVLKAIELLRAFGYDIKALSKRRLECERENADLIVWTNERLAKWCEQIDLGEYVDNLRESGVHGALAVLDASFNVDVLASALGISSGRQMVRKHLSAEFEILLQDARLQWDRHQAAVNKSGRAGGSLTRAFARSYTISGDQGFDMSPPTDSKRSSSRKRNGLRGSIGRVFGLRVNRAATPSNDSGDRTQPFASLPSKNDATISAGNTNNGQTNNNNTQSPKPLTRSTGTLSSTTSDLGSSIERSQHMKTILGTPKVLIQPPMTAQKQSDLKSSASDAGDLSRLQHLCLSPGEVLLNGASSSRNPLIRLRNKNRSANGKNVGRSPGATPARPHSVGDFGGLSYQSQALFGNSQQHNCQSQAHQQQPDKKAAWWKPSSNSQRVSCGDQIVGFSPQRLQNWLSMEHFGSGSSTSTATTTGGHHHQHLSHQQKHRPLSELLEPQFLLQHQQQLQQISQQSLQQQSLQQQQQQQQPQQQQQQQLQQIQQDHQQQQQQQQQHDSFHVDAQKQSQSSYVMGTIVEQGEPLENDVDSQDSSRLCQQAARACYNRRELTPRHDRRSEESLGSQSSLMNGDSSTSPCRRNRPKSLPLRSTSVDTIDHNRNYQYRNQHVYDGSTKSQACHALRVPPLASVDSIHETDL